MEADRQKGIAAGEHARAEAMLARTRDLLYVRQVNRAAGATAADPGRAAGWLDDPRACPPELREFAWHLLRARSRTLATTAERHTGGINALAATPDGSLVVTAGADGAVIGWDGSSDAERFRIEKPHDGQATAAGLSADGRTLVTAGWDGAVRVWNVATRTTRGEPVQLSPPVLAVAVAADGKTVAAGGAFEAGKSRVRVWAVQTGETRADLIRATGPVRGLTFSPDGQTLAAGYAAKGLTGEAVLWDVSSAAARQVFAFSQGFVPAVAFSPDGTRFAAGSLSRSPAPGRNTVRVWSVATGKLLSEPEAVSGAWAVRFSPDGAALAVAHESGEITVWHSATGARRTVLHGHVAAQRPPANRAVARPGELMMAPRAAYRDQLLPGETGRAVVGVAFAAGGKRLVSAGADRTVRTWNLDPDACSRTLAPEDYSPTCLALSADSRAVYFGCDDRAGRRWDPTTGRVEVLLRDLTGPVRDVAVSPDGKAVAVVAVTPAPNAKSSPESEVQVWDVGRSTVTASARARGAAGRLQFTPDGRRVAVAMAGRVAVLPVADSRFTEYPTAATLPILASGRTGSELLVADGRAVRVIDAADGRVVANWAELTGVAVQLATAPGSDLAVVAWTPRVGRPDPRPPVTIEARRLGSGEPVSRFTDELIAVSSLCLSPLARTLATAGTGAAMRLWHIPTGQELAAIDGRAGTATDVRFYADGDGLAARVQESQSRRARLIVWGPGWLE